MILRNNKLPYSVECPFIFSIHAVSLWVKTMRCEEMEIGLLLVWFMKSGKSQSSSYINYMDL